MVLRSKQFVNHVSINLLGFNLLDLFIEIFKRFYQVTETLQFFSWRVYFNYVQTYLLPAQRTSATFNVRGSGLY